MDAHKYCWDAYDKLKNTPDGKWLPLSRSLERYIPKEYISEMNGIADGSGIEYDKILFLNTLTTISMADGCFVFAFKDNESEITTVRQIDISTNSPYSKKMILYIIKPQQGYGFAAFPHWPSDSQVCCRNRSGVPGTHRQEPALGQSGRRWHR